MISACTVFPKKKEKKEEKKFQTNEPPYGPKIAKKQKLAYFVTILLLFY